uniref:Uncharacterized protein n=1 Tax=Callorhinchus milii TaxID=7868 RepID=A0A4W3J3F9_CALMI
AQPICAGVHTAHKSPPTVIRNINTYARTKTIAQGFLDMALFTANASQMKHLLQEGPSTQFYYFLFVLLVCIFRNKWTTLFLSSNQSLGSVTGTLALAISMLVVQVSFTW